MTSRQRAAIGSAQFGLGLGALALAVLLAGATAAEAGDVVYRVIGTVPFPKDAPPRRGADADPLDVAPRPSWVDERYWDQLVFDLLDEPDGDKTVIRTRGLTRDELASLDIYIETPAPEADVPSISDEMVTWWMRTLPDAVRQLTGQPWRGSISSGTDSPTRETIDQVHIRIGTAAEFEEDAKVCAYAQSSIYTFPDGSFAEWHSAEIVISPTAQERCSIYDDSQSYTMVHELGHVLGLYHVDDPADLMYGNEHPEAGYTQRLIDHTLLLYQTGPTVRYPGFEVDSGTTERWTAYFEDLAYDAAADEFTGDIGHDGGGEGTASQALGWDFRFYNAAGRRLDRDGQYSYGWQDELEPWPTLWTFTVGPGSNASFPAGWFEVEAVVGASVTNIDNLFALDCVDGDDTGSAGTFEFNDEEFSSCRYRRSDLTGNAEPARWTGYIENLRYDGATGVLNGLFSHDGGGEGTPIQGSQVEMQLHDAGGRRLDRDGQYVFDFDQQLAAFPVDDELIYDPAIFGPLPEAWDSLTILLRARTTARPSLFAVDCTDRDGVGESRTMGAGADQFTACHYRRSDIETPAPVPALPLGGLVLGWLVTAGVAVWRRRRAR